MLNYGIDQTTPKIKKRRFEVLQRLLATRKDNEHSILKDFQSTERRLILCSESLQQIIAKKREIVQKETRWAAGHDRLHLVNESARPRNSDFVKDRGKRWTCMLDGYDGV